MRGTAKSASARSNSVKPTGHGVTMPSGRPRLVILAAAVAAFLLVPVAQAFAGETVKVHITNVGGEGTGSVRSGPNASTVAPELFWGTAPYIECKGPPTASIGPGTCETEMLETEPGFEQIYLQAEPGPKSELVEWTIQQGEFEACGPKKTNEGACMPYVETGEGEAEVTAVFACETPGACKEPVKLPHLTVFKIGEGTVVASPGGVCTPAQNPCLFEIEPNAMVALTASPATGFAFSAWAGCTEHVGLTCKVKMEKAMKVMVTFVKTPSLTVEKAGYGYGKVAAMGISCDENCSKATSGIKTGTVVTVKATPAKGSEAAVFEGGTGSASGCSGASCTFTISENSSVKVKFNAIPTKTLTVNLAGPAAYKGKVSGKGIVSRYGSAINCGTGCTSQTESFFSTDTVTLTAAAATGYTFGGWSGTEAGTCTGTTTPCTVKTDADKTLSAEFK